MGKRVRAIGVLALAAALAVVGNGGFGAPRSTVEAGVLAAASTTFGTGIQVVNLSDSQPATIVVQAYTSTGSAPSGWPAAGVTLSVDAGKSTSLSSGNGNDAVFKFIPTNSLVSFVFSSDQPIAASVNTQRVGAGSANETLGTSGNPFRLGTASGVSDASSGATVYLPQLPVGIAGFQARAYIQNTSASQATVTIQTFSRSDGSQVDSFQQNIPAFSSFEFNPGSRAAISAAPGNYSVKVTASDTTQKLAAAVNFFNAGTDASTSQFMSYNGASQGSTTLFGPRVVRKFFGYNGGISVQNIGNAATNITMEFNFPGGTTCSITYNAVAAGQAVGPFMGNDTTSDGKNQCIIDTNSVSGALKVTSSGQPIIGIMNEDNASLGQGSTYNLFRQEDLTKTAVVPQFINQLVADLAALNATYVSGFQYQNVGAVAATCTETYSQAGRDDVTRQVTVQPGTSESKVAFNVPNLTTSFNGAMKIACDQNVAAIANISVRAQQGLGAAGSGDSYSAANAINK